MSTKVLSTNNICDTLFHQQCFPGLLTAQTLRMDNFSQQCEESLFVRPLLSDKNLVGIDFHGSSGVNSDSGYSLWKGPFGGLQQEGYRMLDALFSDAGSTVAKKTTTQVGSGKVLYSDAVAPYRGNKLTLRRLSAAADKRSSPTLTTTTTQVFVDDSGHDSDVSSSSSFSSSDSFFGKRAAKTHGSKSSFKKNRTTKKTKSQPKKTASVSKKILQIEKREQEKLRKRFGEQAEAMEQQENNSPSSNSIVKVRIRTSPSQHTDNKFNVLKSLLNL